MKDKIFKRSAIISILLHVLVIAGLPRGCTLSGEAKQKHEQTEELKENFKENAKKQGLPEEMVDKMLEHLDREFSEFIAKQEKEEIQVQTKIKLVKRGPYVPPKPKPECESGKYIGVGFSYSDFLRDAPEVVEIAPGYAADRAGLKLGDVITGIIDHRNPTIVGGIDIISDYPKVNTYVDMLIIRNGIPLRLTMAREEVCYKKKEKKND